MLLSYCSAVKVVKATSSTKKGRGGGKVKSYFSNYILSQKKKSLVLGVPSEASPGQSSCSSIADRVAYWGTPAAVEAHSG